MTDTWAELRSPFLEEQRPEDAAGRRPTWHHLVSASAYAIPQADRSDERDPSINADGASTFPRLEATGLAPSHDPEDEHGHVEAVAGIADDEVAPMQRTFVRWLQATLNGVLGLDLVTDGVMGPKTRTAVRTFQAQRGLKVDGIVGPITEAALREAERSAGGGTRAAPVAPSTPSGPFSLVAVERPGGGRVQDKRDPAAADIAHVSGVGGKQVPLHRLAAAAWTALTQAARGDGIAAPLLLPVSGYRSSEHQARLFATALKKYGSREEARKWVAPPGSSAHQSGRAVDCHLGLRNSSGNVGALRRTAAYQWLVANAISYGFYPYEREPWHWEYNPPASAADEVAGEAPSEEAVEVEDEDATAVDVDEFVQEVAAAGADGDGTDDEVSRLFEGEDPDLDTSEPDVEEEVAAAGDGREARLTQLGGQWSLRRGGTPNATDMTAWLRRDLQETLEGARKRFKAKLNAAAVERAWFVSRREQMEFQNASWSTARGPAGLKPPTDKPALVHSPLIVEDKPAPVAPIMVRFVEELQRRYTKTFTAKNYPGHGGGAFHGRGYSLDLYLTGRDDRGFYPAPESIAFLRAIDATARGIGCAWRVLYNDFTVADAINRELGRRHVVFMGTVRRTGGSVTGLNWHGPEPLILHFHLDLAPHQGDQTGSAAPTPHAGASATTAPKVSLTVDHHVVRFVQRVLNATIGAGLVVDGALGPKTRAAIARFRSEHGLEAGTAVDHALDIALAQRALEEFARQSMFARYGVLDDRTREEIVRFRSAHAAGTSDAVDARLRSLIVERLG